LHDQVLLNQRNRDRRGEREEEPTGEEAEYESEARCVEGGGEAAGWRLRVRAALRRGAA